MASVFARACALAAAGRPQEAILLVRQEAARGDAEALFVLADWTLTGEGVPQNVAQARELYRRAGDAGHALAATFHTNLLASGVGGPPDWPRAVERLRAEASADPARRKILSLIEAMALAPDGAPAEVPGGRRLSASPEVSFFEGLFSPAECDHLVAVAEPAFTRSVITDVRTGRQHPDPVRTSDGAGLNWLLADPAVHALNRRLAAISGTSVEQGEPLYILRYRPGQQYRPHVDAYVGKPNQRVMTALVYLNDDYEGGETVFPRAPLRLKCRKGDAILFRNTLADGRPDPASEHAGLPVTSGTKFVASRWICERPFVW